MILRTLSACALNTAYATVTNTDNITVNNLQAVISGFTEASIMAESGFLVVRRLEAIIYYPVFTCVQLEAVTALADFTFAKLVARFGSQDSLVVATLQANMRVPVTDSSRIVDIYDNKLIR